MSKYQKQIVDICGFSSKSVGKPGVQSRAAELWINSKKIEIGSQTLCLSVSMDGKRIAMSESGVEDMAGIGNSQSREDDMNMFQNELLRLESLVIQNDRKSLFSVYDSLTLVCQQLVTRMVSIELLLLKNNKLLDRNPLLSKYIFVLKNQLSAGEKLIQDMKGLQSQVISAVVAKRNCEFLLPVNNTVDLNKQANFYSLSSLVPEEETVNTRHINNASKDVVLKVSWCDILPKLTRSMEKFGRDTQTFSKLVKSSYLASDQVFTSCSLGKCRPLQEIKNIFAQAHSKSSSIQIPAKTNPVAVATFCANVASMTFGKNCIVHEGGVHINNGICATPDLLVYNTSRMIDYTVRVIDCKSNVFKFSTEDLSTCLTDAYICGAAKGTILLSCSDAICVAFVVPPDRKIVQDMLALSDSYLKLDKCISKRSSEMLKKIKVIESTLMDFQERVTILGCYPMVDEVNHSQMIELGEARQSTSTSNISIKKLNSVLSDIRFFLAKKAKELIALNISDLSGNPSKTPHTILGATYLTSDSLKVVGQQCISEVCEMLEKNNAEVLNIGVDGESLHMATILPDGSAGTFQSLLKHLHDKLKEIKKDKLAELVSSNPSISMSGKESNDDLDDDVDFDIDMHEKNEGQIRENILNSVALLENQSEQISHFTVEDVEDMISDVHVDPNDERKKAIKALKLSELRIVCLRHVIPRAKKLWLSAVLGKDHINIDMPDGTSLQYVPNSIFQKTKTNLFRTISFDYAHILNLFREHAAKGKLSKLGLKVTNLERLSTEPDFSYLKRIIAIKGKKLEFDSMNQKASALLFSEKTARGLALIGDKNGSQCVEVICHGVGSLDESGISSEARIKNIVALKSFLEEKNDFVERLKRPDSENMTNELLQMVLTTLDSYIYTSLNMRFFNVRRKGKLSKH